MNDPTAKDVMPNGIGGDQVTHNDNEHDTDDEGNDTAAQNVVQVPSTPSQVRDVREPSASDQNSTPTRSPSRPQHPVPQQQQPQQQQPHRHHHRHHHQQHRQHRTAAAADPLTPPSPPPTQLAAAAAQSPVFASPRPSSSAAAAATAVKVNAAIDDPDDVTPTKSLATASPLAKVHRRPGVSATAFGVQSFSDPTASPSGSRHHHPYGKQSSASSTGSHRPASAAAGASAAAAIGLNGGGGGASAVGGPSGHHHQASASSLPTAASSPAHRKRSKSESRRRRERKMIAAGELEVRQANETLMRYLRQCTEINDASLSGELEIDQSYDDRRVHRKTRSQRERRGFHMGGGAGAGGGGGGVGAGAGGFGGHAGSSAAAAAALAAAGSAGAGAAGGVVGARGRLQLQNGLTNILNSLVEDIRPASGGGGGGGDGGGGAGSAEIYNPFTPVISPSEGAPHMGIGSKMFVQHHHYRRDVDDGMGDEDVFGRGDVEHGMGSASPLVQSIIDMSCTVQRFWILLSNLCHGLLGGLAFAHLLLVMTTNPYDWLDSHGGADGDGLRRGSTLAHAYASSFYALAVVCLVSVFDRMDFCRLNSSFSEAISFRWVIVLMLYLATNILSLSTEATIEHNDFSITNSTEWLEKMENNRVLDVWNSLSIVRSVCALFGWLLVGMFPQDDLLFDHLADMEKHQLR